MEPKHINYYLMDGDPSGRVKCTLMNWSGVAYRIPRTALEKCADRPDLSYCGVYFLFGASDDTGEGVVYVGQAIVRNNGEGVLYRLKEHKRNPNKEYWTEAVVFVTRDNSIGPTEASWLENRFCKLAVDAKRYTVKNGNEPNPGNVTEEKESELREFAETAKMVMGALGYKLFDPLFAAPSAQAVGGPETAPEILRLRQGAADARGCRTSDGFVLLKGSKIKPTVAQSCPRPAKELRALHAPNISGEHCLLEDILLKSPNQAAAFVTGTSINALEAWKTADGKTLKELEASETGAA